MDNSENKEQESVQTEPTVVEETIKTPVEPEVKEEPIVSTPTSTPTPAPAQFAQEVNIPEDYRPISMWGYLGYQILFAIPCVGFILILVFSFGGNRNINVRNFARAYLLAFVIGLIIVGILFAIFGAAIFGAASSGGFEPSSYYN